MKICATCGKPLGNRSYLLDKPTNKRQCSGCYQRLNRPSKEKKKQYQRTWRKNHPDQVARIRDADYWSFRGHAYAIYRGIAKNAKRWELPLCTWKEFWDWTKNNPDYKRLYDQWISDRDCRFFSWLVDNQIRSHGEQRQETNCNLDPQLTEKCLITEQIQAYSPPKDSDGLDPSRSGTVS